MSEFLTRPAGNTPEELQDKTDIQELLYFERYCRDNALWDEMRKCYAPDSVVDISWYRGSGAGFVDASSKMGGFAPHRIHGAMTWVNGLRAVTVMPATLEIRREVEGTLCELFSDIQLHFCTEKRSGQWFITRFESIYEKDRLVPVLPGAKPEINSSELKKYRKSYACMSYTAEINGIIDDQNLAGLDRPETVDSLRQRLKSWLKEGSAL